MRASCGPLHAPAARRSVRALATALIALATAGAHAQVTPLGRETICAWGAPVLIEVKVGPDATVGRVELVEDDRAVPLRLDARLIWPVLPAPAGDDLLRWAAASNPMRFLDDRPLDATSAYLAVELPARKEAEGPTRARLRMVGGATVALRIHAAGPEGLFDGIAARASMIAPQGTRDPLISIADPRAPLERFRYAIGVPMRGWPEPGAFGAPDPDACADAVAARANTALWRAALARIHAASPGPAIELAELLVATCNDSDAPGPIAAWIAGPDELASVLRLAFSSEFGGERLASAINEMLRVRSPILWWVEDSDARSVTVAFANPTTRAQLVRYHWVIGSDEDMLPLVLEIPSAEVRRATIARPTLEQPRLLADRPEALERLRLSCEGIDRTVVVPPASVALRPLGIEVGEFFPPLTLPSVAAGTRAASTQAPGAASNATRVAMRERLVGWELFVDGRPLESDGEQFLAAGPSGASVRISAAGAIESERCTVPPEAVEFAVHGDHFRAAFFIPPEWISRETEATRVEVGFRRTLPGGFVDAPFPTVPWRARPRTMAFDLSSPQ